MKKVPKDFIPVSGGFKILLRSTLYYSGIKSTTRRRIKKPWKSFHGFFKAGNGSRTRDIDLGKVALYH